MEDNYDNYLPEEGSDQEDSYQMLETVCLEQVKEAKTTEDCLAIFFYAPNSDNPAFESKKLAITKAMLLAKGPIDRRSAYAAYKSYYSAP